MRERQEETKNNNVENQELKALAKALVTAAIEEGLTVTKICEIVREVRNEIIDDLQPKLVLPEETEEEKEFRKKAIKLIQDKPQIRQRCFNLDYVEDGEKKRTNAALELLCAMHKVFVLNSDEVPTRVYVKNFAKNRLKAIADRDYPAGAELNRASENITKFYKPIYNEYWYDQDFKEFSSHYNSRLGTISHEIILIEWYIKTFY